MHRPDALRCLRSDPVCALTGGRRVLLNVCFGASTSCRRLTASCGRGGAAGAHGRPGTGQGAAAGPGGDEGLASAAARQARSHAQHGADGGRQLWTAKWSATAYWAEQHCTTEVKHGAGVEAGLRLAAGHDTSRGPLAARGCLGGGDGGGRRRWLVGRGAGGAGGGAGPSLTLPRACYAMLAFSFACASCGKERRGHAVPCIPYF